MLTRLLEERNARLVRSLTVYHAYLITELERQLQLQQEQRQKEHLLSLPEGSNQVSVPAPAPALWNMFRNLTVLRCVSFQSKPYSRRQNAFHTESTVAFLIRAGEHLQVLELGYIDDDFNWRQVLTFLQNHLYLRQFTLLHPYLFMTASMFRGFLKSCTSSTNAPLEKIKFGFSLYYDVSETQYNRYFSNHPWFGFEKESPGAPTKRSSSPLKELDISAVQFREGQAGTVLPFLKRFCPSLERLVLSDVIQRETEELTQAIECGLPQLQHLDMTLARTSDDQTAKILRGCGSSPRNFAVAEGTSQRSRERGLVSFLGPVGNTQIGSLSIDALVNYHGESLQELDLTRCSSVSGEMIKRVLESCPRLIRFRALRDYADMTLAEKRSKYLQIKDPFVDYRDSDSPQGQAPTDEIAQELFAGMTPLSVFIIGPPIPAKPWACSRSLRVLSLQYLETDSQVFPLAFVQQLARLTQLEELRLQRRTLLASL
ncbi:hypothetical protein BGZ83_004183, partial [Gryganskiella cystojenkinii]